MSNKSFRKSSSPDLEGPSLEEARGIIIHKFYNIEEKIDFMITEYFKPESREDFQNLVLHTSIINIGAKLKVLTGLSILENRPVDLIRRLSSIRNSFAHAPVVNNCIISSNRNSVTISEGNDEIAVMKSNGKLEPKGAFQYFEEFNDLYEEVVEILSIEI